MMMRLGVVKITDMPQYTPQKSDEIAKKSKRTRIFAYTRVMKTKLTLTVQKKIVQAARKRSRKTGKSISGLFEEVFEEKESHGIQSEPQRAAKRLLLQLEKATEAAVLDDKSLLRKHIKEKYA